MKRIAERIADWLADQGVEQVFTVTGGGAMFLNQALGGHGRLRCTFMHHEQACAMAAEGYAHIAGTAAASSFRNRYVPSVHKAQTGLGLPLRYTLAQSILHTAEYARP